MRKPVVYLSKKDPRVSTYPRLLKRELGSVLKASFVLRMHSFFSIENYVSVGLLFMDFIMFLYIEESLPS